MSSELPTPAETQQSFPIVGIGASAGGLEALMALVERLTASGMAFVVVQHLAPGQVSTLAEILASRTPLPVMTILDKQSIQTNTIYVIPPAVDVVIRNRRFALSSTVPSEHRGGRHSIDTFLQSLAADQGARSIGVILSGAGSDGTLGLKAIKEEGGITFVQEPASAAHASMPQSALNEGHADFCLDPAAIADELMRLARHSYVTASRTSPQFDEELRSRLFVMLRRAFGVDFSAYKQSTLERRIQRRMALHKLDRLEDYLAFVQAKVSELNLLYSDLLIGVTAWFRDGEPLEALKTVVFPSLLENRGVDVPLRIWVAGCATGEEAYSIAMCLNEYLEERGTHCKVQIFATDIDDQALAEARTAVYPPNIEQLISADRLQRFFTPTSRGYLVARRIRDMVVFARHNLGKDPPFSRVDLVSCRNVLIYMQDQLQKKVLGILHYALNPGGFLLLGTSEAPGDAAELFTLVDRNLKIYAKKSVVSAGAADFARWARSEAEPGRARTIEQRPAVTLLQLADRKVIEKYSPPGIVVDEALNIVQFRGKTARFLEAPSGMATLNLLKLVRPELMFELRPALQKAITENVSVVTAPVRLKKDREFVTVSLDIMPLPGRAADTKNFLILFQEQSASTGTTPPGPGEAYAASASPPDDDTSNPLVQDLERELSATKEYLQATIEDLEMVNQDLQSANEELQSANEELQSTNEELETSQEELQSTNEELVTLNEELQNRMAQVALINDDLQNVFASASTALIVVGMDLRVRRFSAAAERLLALNAEDVGRPIAHIRNFMIIKDIERVVLDAISAIQVKEHQVRGTDGTGYRLRVAPYRTTDHAIRGAVIEFIRAQQDPRLEEPGELRGLARSILDAIPHALVLLDKQLTVVWANRGFVARFSVGRDIQGQALASIWDGPHDQPALWKLLEDTVSTGRPFQNVQTQKPYGRPHNRPLTFSARWLAQEDNLPPMTLVTVEEGGDSPNAGSFPE